MRLSASLFVVILILPSCVFAQMTHEETVVRSAYAKLGFAIEQVAVSQLAMEAVGVPTPKELASVSKESRLANSQINFDLADFEVGNAQDILTRQVVDFINPPQQEQLNIQLGRHSYHDGQEFQWFSPIARWRPATPVPPEVASMNLRDFFQLQWKQQQPTSVWQTYASYSVTVTYQGKTVGPYRALFMFGHDANGGEIVEPEDGTTDAIGIAAAMREHLFADALVKTRLRDVPVASNWINAKQQDAQNCSEDQGVCCDLSHVRCGPSQSAVEKGRAIPLPKKGDPR